jgi:hypothetical protein
MYWIALALAGGSLFVSVTILSVVLAVLRTTRRAKRAGDERLEILREQQQRLQFLREERRTLEEELRWRRSMMEGEQRLPELMAPPDSNGHSRFEQPKLRSWLRHILDRAIGSSPP